MTAPGGWSYFGCFLRSYFVGAAYNLQGLQNIGFLFALDPVLRKLYPDEAALREARLRHARCYNCHPFFTPMYLGMILRMENAIASRQLDPAVLLTLKDATANMLSAIGDSFFNGTLLSTWALASACLILAGHPLEALLLTGLLLFALQIFKLVTFVMGLRKGMAVLAPLKRLGLPSCSLRLKYGNAALLGYFIWLALPGAPALEWIATGCALLAASWLVGRLHVMRIFVAIALFALAAAVHWIAGACTLGFL